MGNSSVNTCTKFHQDRTNNEYDKLGKTEISVEEQGKPNSTFIFSEFQTVIKTKPNEIFGFCKRHFVQHTVIFAMNVF